MRDSTLGSLHDEDVEDPDWARIRPRTITDDQWRRFEGYMAEILSAMGLRLDTPGTEKTPRRYLRALFDSTEGYEGDSKLVTAFPTECHGGADCQISQIVEGPIPFYSLCAHHAFPLFGHAFVGYIAHEHVTGNSKRTRRGRPSWTRVPGTGRGRGESAQSCKGTVGARRTGGGSCRSSLQLAGNRPLSRSRVLRP